MSKIVCPHCGKEIEGKDYNVVFIARNSKGEEFENSLIWEDCYTPEHAVTCMKQFDEDFVRLVRVEEVKTKP